MKRLFKSVFLLAIAVTFTMRTTLISATTMEVSENEIVLKTSTGDIFGSFLTPEDDSKDIVVLFICGSGPTDRNGNNPQMSNNSIRFLAEDLSNAGIPSVRYDKRGIAVSASAGGKEENLRFSHYVDDARAWIDLLAKDYKRVILIGHSEGAQIGVLAAIDNPHVAAVITIAGAGRKLDEVLKAQLAEQSPTLLTMAEPFIESLKNGVTITTDVPQILASLFRPTVQPYLISWFATDPAAEIAKLTVPVLIIQGEKDIQTLREDATLLQNARPQAKTIIIPNMNHVFKECPTTDRILQMQTYMNPNLKNIPALSQEIIGFILNPMNF
jgi:pimeloyl-ACP methyl ester carboxylesterase